MKERSTEVNDPKDEANEQSGVKVTDQEDDENEEADDNDSSTELDAEDKSQNEDAEEWNEAEETQNESDEESTETGSDGDSDNGLDPELAKEIAESFPRPREVDFRMEEMLDVDNRNPSTGVLAAKEVMPVAWFADLQGYEFYARGVTLVIDDKNGIATQFQGNARIRLTGPGKSPYVKPPSRARVRWIRRGLFRTNQQVRRNQDDCYAPEQQETKPAEEDSQSPHPQKGKGPGLALHELNGEELTPEEIGAVVSDLKKLPIRRPGRHRIYQIQKDKDGRVIVERMLGGEWSEGGERANMQDDSEEPNASKKAKEKVSEELTELRNDPHPSDTRLAESNEKTVERGLGPFSCENEECSSSELEVARDPWDSEYAWELKESDKELADSQTIKPSPMLRQEEVNNNDSHSPRLSQIPSTNPHSPTPCLQSMNSNPDNSRPTPRTVQSPAKADRDETHPDKLSKTMPPPPDPSVQAEDDVELRIPPVPIPPRPGLLAAAHLAQLQDPESTPLEPSFFAYGATVVLSDEHQVKRTHQGHALIRMYSLETPGTHNYPVPPPPGRSEVAQAILSRPYPSLSARGESPPELSRSQRQRQEPSISPLARLEPVTANDPETNFIDQIRVKRSPSIRASPDPDPGTKSVDVLIGIVKSPAPEMATQPSQAEDAKNSTCNAVLGEDRDEKAGPSTETHLAPEKDKEMKRIDFVPGGTIPGTFEPKDSVPSSVDKAKTYTQPDKPPTHEVKRQIGSTIPLPTHPEQDEPTDVHMSQDDDYDKLPELTYPPASPTPDTTPCMTPDTPDELAVDIGETHPVSDAVWQYVTWRHGMRAMKTRIDQGTPWSEADAQRIFGDLGLLQWWFDIRYEEEAGIEIEWEKWRGKAVTEWKKRYPAMPPLIFECAADNLRDPDGPSGAPFPEGIQALIDQAKQHKDTAMDTSDAPDKTQPITIPIVTNPNAAKSIPIDAAPALVELPDEDLAQIRERIDELDAHVNAVKSEMRHSLRCLRDQVFEDGVVLTKLKWKVASKRRRGKRSRGKRSYRKAEENARVPTHRYPTRYSTKRSEQEDEGLEGRPEEQADVEGRIRTIEERQKEAKSEIEKVIADLTHTDEMAPKIELLAASLVDFRSTQVKLNLGILAEIAKIKLFFTETVEPKINAQADALATLTARYNVLSSIVSHLLASRIPSVPPIRLTDKAMFPHAVPQYQTRSQQVSPPSYRMPAAV